MDQEPSRLEVCPLNLQQFWGDFEGESSRAQANYLWKYLEAIGARSFVREQAYVDRHFLEDFTNYYARSFRPPDSRCRRLHYFRCEEQELNEHLDAFYRGGRELRDPTEKKLNDLYLGFVVRRPLRGAQIGRTVLRTYEGDPGRLFTVVRPYRVHLGAIRLRVDGLAFQEQDVGVAVCAAISLWCALQKVAHASGQRTPTPSAITIAAASPYAASEGLTDPQMATALDRLGFAADTFTPGISPGEKALFRAHLAACLRSHLPVILMVQGRGAHAITCTGYRQPSAEQIREVPITDTDNIRMRGGSLRTIYVHDDNLGCHAHYELHDSPPPGFDPEDDDTTDPDLALWLARGRTDEDVPAPTWWEPTCLRVLCALVPKPTKLRLPVDRLVHLAAALQPVVREALQDLEEHYEVAFSSGVDYRRAMLDLPLDRASLRALDMRMDLPRHLAVVSVYLDEDLLCDLLVDATTIDLRPDDESLLAIVAPNIQRKTKVGKRLKEIAENVNIPIIFREPPPR